MIELKNARENIKKTLFLAKVSSTLWFQKTQKQDNKQTWKKIMRSTILEHTKGVISMGTNSKADSKMTTNELFKSRLLQLINPNKNADPTLTRGVIPNKEIEAKRNEKGLSMNDVAKMCDVSAQAVANWVNLGTLPKTDKLNKLSEAFGVSVQWLLGKTDIPIASVELAATAYRDLGISEKTYQALIELKNKGTDMKKFMSGINALFEYPETLDDDDTESISNIRKEYRAIEALNAYLTEMFEDGTPTLVDNKTLEKYKDADSIPITELKKNRNRIHAMIHEEGNFYVLSSEIKSVREKIIHKAYTDLEKQGCYQYLEEIENSGKLLSKVDWDTLSLDPQAEAIKDLKIMFSALN